ncbi:MAG: phosphoribosylglycinamide formyltransferase [Bacteroidales bacterium]|nr:phosphoribosylglycinamide formyltransferase [Bacteroidales bacterium]
MTNLAIFASGSGTNAENIARYFADSKEIGVKCIVANNQKAGVLERAKRLKIPSYYFSNTEIKKSDALLECLKNHQIDYIILAGFLALIPSKMVTEFPNRILNIHPALLPSYGGKGMYGDNVHKAVLANRETQSGISIHYVNEKYDEGKLILQAYCPIFDEDSVESLANRIHKLEYRHYPQAIEQVIQDYSD